MRTEDVLAAVGTGTWRWDDAHDIVELDEVAARLLDLPPGTREVHTSVARACYHASDYVQMNADVELALSEGRVSETVARIMGADGRIVRRVLVRASGRLPERPGEPFQVFGMMQEAGPLTGSTAGAAGASGASGPESCPDATAAPRRAARESPPGTRATPTTPGAAEPAAPGEPGTRAPDWPRAREAFLLDAGRALAEAESTQAVLRVASHLSMPGFSPDALAVLAVQGDRLVVIGHQGRRAGDRSPFTELPLAVECPPTVVVRTGRAVYIASPEEYEQRYPAVWSMIRDRERHSWAFLPLVTAGRVIGVWMAAFSDPVGFGADERSVLTTVARMLAQAISRAHLHDSERELSAGLQRGMIPVAKPDIPGMAVAARYVPTGGGLQVGGDWYDVIALPSGRTALVVGDVQGHDARAAGVMAQLRIALRAYAAEGHRPDAVLSRTSRFLAGLPGGGPGGGDDRFATCLYAEVDAVHGTLDVVRAGHPEPAVRMPDGTTVTRGVAGGLPLGVAWDADYPTTRFTLAPGETLLVCTDGLIETGGHDLETGWKRLRTVLEETAPEAPAATGDLEGLADALVETVQGPPSHHTTGPFTDRREDDIALVLLRRDPEGVERALPARGTVLSVAQDDPRAIREARHEIRALLHDWRRPDQADAAVLLTSELVTNVLVHTDEDAVVTFRLSGPPGTRLLHVEVRDANDDMPHRRSPGELASTGRGLLLIEELADAWGVRPHGEGKAIWFELREGADSLR